MEKLVYVMPILLNYDLVDLLEASDGEFMELAKEEGRIYDLSDFSRAFLENEVSNGVDYFRIL